MVSILLATNIIFREWSANPSSNRVTVTFDTKSETGVFKFRIMRSLDDRTFMPIGTLKPHGTNKKYEFIDKDVFKTTTQTFFYRIRAQREDDSIIEESGSCFANPNISGSAKATWGAVKDMFNR
jgi:hypothetical protein